MRRRLRANEGIEWRTLKPQGCVLKSGASTRAWLAARGARVRFRGGLGWNQSEGRASSSSESDLSFGNQSCERSLARLPRSRLLNGAVKGTRISVRSHTAQIREIVCRRRLAIASTPRQGSTRRERAKFVLGRRDVVAGKRPNCDAIVGRGTDGTTFYLTEGLTTTTLFQRRSRLSPGSWWRHADRRQRKASMIQICHGDENRRQLRRSRRRPVQIEGVMPSSQAPLRLGRRARHVRRPARHGRHSRDAGRADGAARDRVRLEPGGHLRRRSPSTSPCSVSSGRSPPR